MDPLHDFIQRISSQHGHLVYDDFVCMLERQVFCAAANQGAVVAFARDVEQAMHRLRTVAQTGVAAAPIVRKLSLFFFFFLFFLEREKPYMSANTANRSNISEQLKETFGIQAYTARPRTGEAAPPWQAICVCVT